ncbi:MAG: UBP-type zinc finger domain-containing protein [Thermoproteota archaeon]|nr:UBP-type zinc finger domain-containing protein [Thermoproteota archaeon]
MGKHNTCEHLAQASENISTISTKECEECKKEGTNWVALRQCLSCGHVGCCDSSPGRHATRHFIDTNHPVMVALPNKAWRWCYIHKAYG